MTTHVYTPTRARTRPRPRAHFPSCLLPPRVKFSHSHPFHPSRSSPFLARSRSFSLVPARPRSLYTPSASTSDVGEERHSRGENENAGCTERARGAARTGVDGCSAHGESGVNTERGVTQGRQQNAGIGEAVTMTTVTGEVLVRIRDHAYVTTP